MTTTQMTPIIQHLRRAALAQYGPGMTDAQILESFLAVHDEAAFEALLRRHGSMVLGVCYRILRDHHAAEDAFQATFLVFARKASSVRPRDRIANWLHGVALRTALKARTMRAKTRGRERQVFQMPEPEATQNDHWDDVQAVLDEELARLPEFYRLPILLCDVEGKSIKEATRQLGWPQGTLAGRLARARKLLAKRLTQRGVTLSAGSLAAVLSAKAASACVSPALAVSTVKAAVAIAAGKALATGAISANVAALTEGVLKGMMLSKLKTVLAVLAVLGMCAFGVGLLSRDTAVGQEIQAEREGEKPVNGQAAQREKSAAEAAPKADDEKAQLTTPYFPPTKKAAVQTEKAQTVSYPVADLVIPIHGLDDPLVLNKKEVDRTKEDWLIGKIIRTVSPSSWKESGGTGTVQFYPLKMSLVVSNTPRVQAQVQYLLETMRRVQEVEVVAETRILLLNAACFLKLQELLPQLKKDGRVVLNDAETFALLRKVQDDAATKVVEAPKITFFSGQRVDFAVEPVKDLPGIKRIAVKYTAMVAANLQHVDLDVQATVGKVEFTNTLRLVEGLTLAQVKRSGDDYLVFLVTPRVILNLENEIATPTRDAESPQAIPPATKKATKEP
jgi:RNA polymerase sigma factor (sigma-70 family)